MRTYSLRHIRKAVECQKPLFRINRLLSVLCSQPDYGVISRYRNVFEEQFVAFSPHLSSAVDFLLDGKALSLIELSFNSFRKERPLDFGAPAPGWVYEFCCVESACLALAHSQQGSFEESKAHWIRSQEWSFSSSKRIYQLVAHHHPQALGRFIFRNGFRPFQESILRGHHVFDPHFPHFEKTVQSDSQVYGPK
jgi:hypothetical protein